MKTADSTIYDSLKTAKFGDFITLVCWTLAHTDHVFKKSKDYQQKIMTFLFQSDYGIWKITKLDANIWDVRIMGESPVDFTYDMIDVSTGIVINEDPIQGNRLVINSKKHLPWMTKTNICVLFCLS